MFSIPPFFLEKWLLIDIIVCRISYCATTHARVQWLVAVAHHVTTARIYAPTGAKIRHSLFRSFATRFPCLCWKKILPHPRFASPSPFLFFLFLSFNLVLVRLLSRENRTKFLPRTRTRSSAGSNSRRGDTSRI